MRDSASPYPPDPWRIRETSFDPSLAVRNETIFALANGTLGLRGTFEEGYPQSVSGTYLNGFYDETPIVYGEIAYGYAKNRQVMLNVVDGKQIRFSVDDEPFDLSKGEILSFERCLDMRAGALKRTVRWRSPRGRRMELSSCRLVSLKRRHVAAIDWAVTLLDGPGTVVVHSRLDGNVHNLSSGDDPRKGSHFAERPLNSTDRGADGPRGFMVQETRNTRFAVACAMDHALDDAAGPIGPGAAKRPAASIAASAEGDLVTMTLQAALQDAASLHLTKFLGYCSSLQFPKGECAAHAAEEARAAREAGFDMLLAEQKEVLDGFWDAADIEIEGDASLQQGLRFNLFSLFQSAGRDGRTSIAAKGLTGEGYEGHYFWDTEIYVVPFFTYTRPEIACGLLRYRCSILDKARARAAEMSQKGALYPWRTIGGEETSAYYPAGTAQYHINADIAHALRTYMNATGDGELLRERGAEMLFETARLWADLGGYAPRKGGAFCIDEVTGPDEYSALVNNNLYTNLMAREHLRYAASTAGKLRAEEPAEYQRIAAAIGLAEDEPAEWGRAASRMYVPYDAALGIYAQDDSFLDRAPWDFKGTPPENFPLLLHYHPLVIYRHQVLKQPDVVLAQVLLGSLFSMAEKKRNFDYYDPLTTGDSSLSPCIQCVAAAELGYGDKAYAYFSRTARMDLDDINGNVEDGVHTAAMAGTWISIVRGFAGMRDSDGRLSFSPHPPQAWSRLRFRLRWQGRLLEVVLTRNTATYLLMEGSSIAITHRGRELVLPAGQPVSIDLSRRLECVVFDLDGVLTDTAELHFKGWERLCAEENIPFSRAVNEHLRGVGRQDSFRIILGQAGISKEPEDIERLSARKNEYYREIISSLTPGDLLPGIPSLLSDLRKNGIRIAIASASRNAPAIIKRIGIESSIDYLVDAGTLAKGKPDPEIFFTAAEGAGVVPENCAGVEDAQVGVQAIKSAGMFTVGIGNGLVGADWLLPDTAGLTYEDLKIRFNFPGQPSHAKAR
ncbi:MAG: beta-phosphoglucomutase [Spirochaetia bacterium]|jgi:alpha,alpha-trehalose phosphorylase